MNLPLLFFAVDVATVVCAVLLAARVLASHPRQPAAQLIALIAVSVVCHVILGRAEYGLWTPPALRIEVGAWRPWLNLGRNLAPGLFMLLVFRLFADRQRPPPVLWGLLAAQLFLEEPVRWLLPAGSALAPLLTQIAPTLLQLLFAGLAVYWTLADWRFDLVEARRRARALVLVVVGINVVASSLLLRWLIPADSLANYQTHLGLGVANLLLMGGLLFRYMGESRLLDPDRPRERATPAAQSADAAALARLERLLSEGLVYREPNLTLGVLAERVGVPEYRLRRLIHEALGHRNFNAFLHSYRIAEACEQLRDPALRRTPILTIGLSVGYQSINTFNRAFREVTGQTPSVWRAAAEASPESA
ncbi:AraC-like DNA-binding protein [Caulobacter ginsengisoli]|uniref:AraC-like DNA-binding protein n=1 Tax=Caulobacter ginsengisoli TaxID=400775 RepID=A0ABU0IPR8_9CAUL|nr:helix-turn-helix transcriptional regulator [Caulobacter ginsengisoli]MDQ0464002.1 AraC-like DNA-binding protein [Caulobacter ginsengisoli]